MYLPYTYLIGWPDLNRWYYGVRYKQNCNPQDLWNPYKTSSLTVKKFILEHGDPPIIRIRKTFIDSTVARNWESRVLKRMKVATNEKWLNLHDSMSPPLRKGKKMPNSFKDKLKLYWTEEKRSERAEQVRKEKTGKKLSAEHKEKLRNKTWTNKAIENRLKNCLESASKRKGVKNPKHGQRIFASYVDKNKDLIKKVWELYDNGLNRRQISLTLNISWDRVNMAINRKDRIIKLLEN
jgi:hypothetical protein